VEASSSDAVLTGSNHYVVLGRVTGSTLIGCDKDFEVAVDLGIKTILDARNFFYERHSNIKSRVDDFLVQKTNPKDENSGVRGTVKLRDQESGRSEKEHEPIAWRSGEQLISMQENSAKQVGCRSGWLRREILDDCALRSDRRSRASSA
jgi:hypothetical protein